MKAYNEPAGEVFDIGYGPTLPDQAILNSGINKTDGYISTEQFENERKLFKKVWLYAGRVERVKNPGQWFVHDIDICDSSVIVVNDRKGGVAAFHNFCPHRGMRLLWEPSGRNNLFVCPYHAWSYATDGSLKAMPDESSFDGLCREENGLIPVQLDIWAGFIFINLDPAPSTTLKEYLGAISERLTDAPFEEFSCSATVTDVVQANWKLGNESATEGYHVPALHAKSASWALPSWNKFAHYLGWEPVGPHRVASVPGNPEFKTEPQRPIQAFSFTYLPQMVTMNSGTQSDTAGKGFGSHPDLNQMKGSDWGADQYSLFPGVALSASFNGWWSNSFMPITPDSCRWVASWYFRSPKSRREQFAMECSATQNRDVLTEDNFSIRGQHQGFKSGVIKQVRFGTAEILLRHQAAVMKAIMDKGVDGNDDRLAHKAAAE